MASLASARPLHEKFNFIVLIDAIENLFFSKASELSKEVARIDYWEGGAHIPIKWPGRVTFSDVTLERGVGNSRDLHDWMLQVVDDSKAGGIGAGLQPADFTRGATILQRDRTKTQTLRKYKLFGAWPTTYVAGDWDNGADEVVIETLTVTFDRYEMISPTPRRATAGI
jgi:phage tail-like protein